MRTLNAFRMIPRAPEDDNGGDASAFGEAPLTADFDERTEGPEPEAEVHAEVEEHEDAPREEAEETPAVEASAEEGDAEPQPEGEAPKPKKDWKQARLDKLVAERNSEREAREALEARVKAMEALYGEKEGQEGEAPKVYTQADFEARARQIAQRTELESRIDRLFDAGAEKFGKDWAPQLAQVNEAFGQDLAQRPDLFDAVTKLPNAAEVYFELSKDLDHLAGVLELSPIELGMELKGLSERLAKPKPQPISRAPAPIKPLDRNNVADMPLEQLANDPSPKAMAEFDRRMRIEEEKRFARR